MNVVNDTGCSWINDLGKLYESRILTRESVCEKFEIDCYSILQPMAGTHGIQIRRLISESTEEMLKKKYKILSTANGYIDLGYILGEDTTLSYIDGVHYSPLTNKKIATELYNKYLK